MRTIISNSPQNEFSSKGLPPLANCKSALHCSTFDASRDAKMCTFLRHQYLYSDCLQSTGTGVIECTCGQLRISDMKKSVPRSNHRKSRNQIPSAASQPKRERYSCWPSTRTPRHGCVRSDAIYRYKTIHNSAENKIPNGNLYLTAVKVVIRTCSRNSRVVS